MPNELKPILFSLATLNETQNTTLDESLVDVTQVLRDPDTRPWSTIIFGKQGAKSSRVRVGGSSSTTRAKPSDGDKRPSPATTTKKQRDRPPFASEDARVLGGASQPLRLSQSNTARTPTMLRLSDDDDDDKEAPPRSFESAPAADEMLDVDEHHYRESSREMLRAAAAGATQSTEERSSQGLGFLAENDFRRVEIGMTIVRVND